MQDLLIEFKRLVSTERGRLYITLRYLDQVKFERAKTVCRAVIETNPDLALALLIMGYIHALEGRFSEATRNCRLALKQDKRLGMAHYLLAIIYYELDQPDEAIKECILALHGDSKRDAYHYLLGELYSQTGQYSRAIDAFRAVVRRSPQSTMAHYKLAHMYLLSGQDHDAMLETESALRSTSSFNSYMTLGNLEFETGNYRQALQDYYRAMGVNPRHPDAHMKIGEVSAIEGNFDVALLELRTAIKIRPNHARSYYLLANVCYLLARYQDAIANYRSAIEIDPHIPFVNAEIGRSYMALARLQNKPRGADLWEQSAKAFREAVKLSASRCQTGDDLADKLRFAEAAGEYQAALIAQTDWSPREVVRRYQNYVYDAPGEGLRARRRRINYSFPLKLKNDRGFQGEGLTLNISKTGLLVETQEPYDIGSPLELLFQFAVAQKPTTVKGIVVRSGLGSPADNGTSENFQTGIALVVENDGQIADWIRLLEM